MENKQINFFKSKDFNTVLKPFKKGTVVKIDSFDIRESKKDLNLGLYGWYAICPSDELPINKLYYFSLFDEPLVLYRDENKNVRCIKNICPHRGASFYGGSISNGVITCPYHGAKFSSGGSCQNLDRITRRHTIIMIIMLREFIYLNIKLKKKKNIYLSIFQGVQKLI